MKKQTAKILNIILGAIISLIVILATIGIGLFFFSFHKSYFPIPEYKDFIYIFISSILLVLLIIALFVLLKKKYKNFAKGLLIGLLPIIIVFIFTTIDFFDFIKPESFDSEKWKLSNPKPYEMAQSIIWKKEALNISKPEIIKIFGNDVVEQYSNDTLFTYQLNISRIAYFQILFNEFEKSEKIVFRYFD